MRVWALALYLVAAVSYCQAEDVEELVKLADKAGAPFTQTALERMQDSELWGAKRHKRSSDVVVINSSTQTFKLVKSDCKQGKLSNGLLPEENLNDKSSTVYGIESSKDFRGVDCSIDYQSDTSFFIMNTQVSVFDDNDAFAVSSGDRNITVVRSKGWHNQVRFTVSDKDS